MSPLMNMNIKSLSSSLKHLLSDVVKVSNLCLILHLLFQERPMTRTSKWWSYPQWTVCTLGPPTCLWRSPRTWPRACTVCTVTPPSGGCPSLSSTWFAHRPGWRRRSSKPPPSWASNIPSLGENTQLSHFSVRVCVCVCGSFVSFSLVINTSVIMGSFLQHSLH